MMTKNKMRGAAGFRAAACALMISAVSVFSAMPAGMLTSYAAPNFQLDTAMNGAGPGTAAAVSSNANVPKYEPRAVSSKVGGYYFNGTGMYTYDQLTADLNSLKSISGFDCGSMGQSPDGRELWHAVIGNPSASRKILVIATMHGREYMVTPVVMRQMKDLLDRRNAGDQMLQDVCFHVLPMINPDGVAISQYGVDGMKTQKMKNTVNNILQSWSSWGIFDDANKYIWYLNKWKNTATGVDLNRNFATNGWTGLNDLRAKASNDLYKGPFVESEPETRVMVQMIQSTQFDEVLSYHMQGQVLYWYAPTGSEAVNNRSREIAEVVKASSGYALVPAENNGTGVGSLKTWLSEMKGIPCVTIEAGIGTCPLPESDLEGVWQRNKDVLYEAALELTVGHEARARLLTRHRARLLLRRKPQCRRRRQRRRPRVWRRLRLPPRVWRRLRLPPRVSFRARGLREARPEPAGAVTASSSWKPSRGTELVGERKLNGIVKDAAGKGFLPHLFSGESMPAGFDHTSAKITAMTSEGRRFATRIVFGKTRFTPTQVIRIFPTREMLLSASGVMNGARKPASSVTEPCSMATGIAEKMQPFPREAVIIAMMMRSRIDLAKSVDGSP